MENPAVSFVVPCYNLAHLLQECVNSILSQSYESFEVLIMDDCSPDNTAEVAGSFCDARVKHIRNDPNLGHLKNYNKGIGLARGRFVWLISADDYLRSPHVLGRFVALLDKHPSVGYAFCPGYGVQGGVETRVIGQYPRRGDRSRIVSGHVILKDLLRSNFILAASGLVRRICYDRLGRFPLNMPWAGDWYLWCVFALHFDVAYVAEPMVCYRQHELSMTSRLMNKSAQACCEEDVTVPWTVKNQADAAGFSKAARECLDAVGQIYAKNIGAKRYDMESPSLTLTEFEKSLCRNTESESERERVRTRVYAALGNEYYWLGETGLAKKWYGLALKGDPRMIPVGLKSLLLSAGEPGNCLRRAVYSLRGGTLPGNFEKNEVAQDANG